MHAVDAAKTFLAKYPSGCVLGLSGDLGAGKTTFVRAVLECLGYSGRVTSPSFPLHQSYPEVGVEHFDLYRLQNIDDKMLMELGFHEAVSKARYVFVEWPEHAKAPLGLTGKLKITVNAADGRRTYDYESHPASDRGAVFRPRK